MHNTSPGDAPSSASSSYPGVFQTTDFAGTQTKWDFMYTLWEWSLCLQSSVFSKVSPPGFQSETFWGYILPKYRAWCGGWNPCLLEEDLYGCDIPPVCRWPTSGYGSQLDCISVPPTSLVWLLLYTCSCGKSFLLVFRLFSKIIALWVVIFWCVHGRR